jgi:hypothetical protein
MRWARHKASMEDKRNAYRNNCGNTSREKTTSIAYV